jgi:hypothetical protein
MTKIAKLPSCPSRVPQLAANCYTFLGKPTGRFIITFETRHIAKAGEGSRHATHASQLAKNRKALFEKGSR